MDKMCYVVYKKYMVTCTSIKKMPKDCLLNRLYNRSIR